MDNYEFTKYVTTKENVRETIERYGVAIIPDVLDEDECSQMVSSMWDYFEHITQAWEKPISETSLILGDRFTTCFLCTLCCSSISMSDIAKRHGTCDRTPR